MQHITKIIKFALGYKLDCAVCGTLPGIFFSWKKVQKSAESHEQIYNSNPEEFKNVKRDIEELALMSSSFEEFQQKVLSNQRLLKLVGKKTLGFLIQRSEAGILLD